MIVKGVARVCHFNKGGVADLSTVLIEVIAIIVLLSTFVFCIFVFCILYLLLLFSTKGCRWEPSAD